MKVTKKTPLRPRGRSDDKRQSTKEAIREAYKRRCCGRCDPQNIQLECRGYLECPRHLFCGGRGIGL